MGNILSLVKTADGSCTLYNAEVGEHYHSTHGALQESRHVFLDAGLRYYLDNNNSLTEVSVLEVGFGTGLNFLLSVGYCSENNIALHYTGIEAFPVEPVLLAQTGYDEYLSAGLWDRFMAAYPAAFTGCVLVDNHQLFIAGCRLLDFQSPKQFDIIFFDAFASARQPEMWNEPAIGHTLKFLRPGGVFVTYAITGNLKRMLKSMGCRIEKIPGAPGKREMLRAVKLE